MDDCCCSGATGAATETAACTRCGTNGKRVDKITIKALLTEHALRRFEPGAYRFCAEASCDIVYFDERGRTFAKADVRVPVWEKEPFGERTLCYCFGENERAIRDECATTGASQAAERVRQHIAARRCACEVRNPRGACCLGDVTAAVRRIREMTKSPVAQP